MGPHPVRVGLDQRRSVAGAGPIESGRRDGVHREHVVAVHAYAGEAEAGRPAVQRDPGLPFDRLGDRPLVVLAEEDHRRVVGAGEDEALVDIALAGGAVAEVADHRGVPSGIAGADTAVPLDAHRVPGGVQRLGADDDRVQVEAVLGHIPGARVDAAEHRQQPQRVDTADPGDAVLAVGREGVVLPVQGATGADLRGLLAQQGGPQAQFPLPLERDRLVVDRRTSSMSR